MTKPKSKRGKPTLGPGIVQAQASAVLARSKLTARNDGTLNSAVWSAAYYAKTHKLTCYVYRGTSNMVRMWRADFKLSNVLSPVNNDGDVIYSVTPALVVSIHAFER